MEKARILVVTGTGKGKTTAALGMVLRGLSHGKKVLLARFIKAAASGELDIMSTLPGLAILTGGLGMTPPPQHPDFPRHAEAARELFAKVKEAADGFDMIAMDEICTAAAKGLVPEKELVDFLGTLRPDQIVILTGRGAGMPLMAVADTVSEIVPIKHAFLRGIAAQEGVEF